MSGMSVANDERVPETAKGNKSAQAHCYDFQFWVGRDMIHDISGITIDDALSLWASCEKEFTVACRMGQEAEIIVWIHAERNKGRCRAFRRVSSADVSVRAGIAYKEEPVFV